MLHNQRRPNRQDKQKTEVRKAIAVLVALFLVVGGIAYFYASARADMRPIDETTFCPKDEKGPNSVTAVLVDKTDTFNPTQQAAIRDRLNDVKDHTSRYDLLEIYSVEIHPEKTSEARFFDVQSGRGEAINQWTGNPHLVEDRWQALFDKPLQHLFDSILEGGTAQISPIMESIQSIVVTRLGSQELVSKKVPRRLIVISDLMQYVKDYSQYKPFASFEKFKTSPYFQNVRSDMSGISVEFWYVRRQSTLAIQKEKHVDFWRDYITDQGGDIEKVWYVPGT